MKHILKRSVCLLLLLCAMLSLLPGTASAAIDPTTPTGYTSAEDVVYKTSGKYTANWGARDEDCTFLSPYAEAFYTGSYTYDTLSAKAGGTGTSDAYKSGLYKALQAMMKAEHTYINSYRENNNYFAYTDCVRNETSMLSSFYSGSMVGSAWVSGGKTYNKEHTWPNSKGLGGSDEDDIMMIRPTITSENSSRGNTAYGESSGYYDPNSLGMDLRGDCARIALYIYVRWGNTSYIWGRSGVIESLDVLLKWMEEDPVDTWEMGRNDAVQSITGTRNVFIDYPEYAWLLFGQEIPEDMVTPSGIAANGTATDPGTTTNPGTTTDPGTSTCAHSATEVRDARNATCTETGYTGNTYCRDCQKKLSSGSAIAAKGHTNADSDNHCDVCDALIDCPHAETEVRDAKDATCSEAGYTGSTYCTVCGEMTASGESIPMTAHTEQVINAKDATCTSAGYTGDTVCSVCGTEIAAGKTIPATFEHSYGDWTVTKDATAKEDGQQLHTCTSCGKEEIQLIPATGTDGMQVWHWIVIGSSTVGIVSATLLIILVRKKKKDEESL